MLNLNLKQLQLFKGYQSMRNFLLNYMILHYAKNQTLKPMH